MRKVEDVKFIRGQRGHIFEGTVIPDRMLIGGVAEQSIQTEAVHLVNIIVSHWNT